MKFEYTKSTVIRADENTVWNTVTDQCFERDFIPEITRRPGTKAAVSAQDGGKSITWTAGSDIDIRLTRNDLNVTIDSIRIDVQERPVGVFVKIHVVYKKPIEKYFFKAHFAIRHLFAIKLRVLNLDLNSEEMKLALT